MWFLKGLNEHVTLFLVSSQHIKRRFPEILISFESKEVKYKLLNYKLLNLNTIQII